MVTGDPIGRIEREIALLVHISFAVRAPLLIHSSVRRGSQSQGERERERGRERENERERERERAYNAAVSVNHLVYKGH